MPDRKTTLRDVARAANLSLAAVSMALNRHPNIPPSTRRAVESVAARLGYDRNYRVSELMSYVRGSRNNGYHETLGYISSHPLHAIPHWQKPYLEGARREAERLRCKLDVFWCEEPRMSKRRLSDILTGRGIRGLLIAPLLDRKNDLPLTWGRFTSVALGYSLARPSIHRVLNHHYNTVLLAMTKLVERGYRRIALALEPVNQWSVNHLWKAAYIAGLEILELPRPPLCFIETFDPAKFHHWYLKHKPDAIIANDSTYYKALHQRGLNAPENFGIVSLTVKEEADKVLSRVDQNHAEEGATAIRLIVGELLHNEIGVPAIRQTVMLDSIWIEGETVRPLLRSPV
jgi:DNA-binding LacI/PurR family transcriptional regulator